MTIILLIIQSFEQLKAIIMGSEMVKKLKIVDQKIHLLHISIFEKLVIDTFASFFTHGKDTSSSSLLC